MRISDWSSDVCSSDLTFQRSPGVLSLVVRRHMDRSPGPVFAPALPMILTHFDVVPKQSLLDGLEGTFTVGWRCWRLLRCRVRVCERRLSGRPESSEFLASGVALRLGDLGPATLLDERRGDLIAIESFPGAEDVGPR